MTGKKFPSVYKYQEACWSKKFSLKNNKKYVFPHTQFEKYSFGFLKKNETFCNNSPNS